jgi:galactokinase
MDQLISVLGDESGALLIDCRSEQTTVVPFADANTSILIANTNVKHTLAGGQYAVRRAQCSDAARKLGLGSLRDASLALVESSGATLSSVERNRALHVVSENERTQAAADALRRGDMEAVGTLMYQSHASLRDWFDVSCPELNILVEEASQIGVAGGVFGARMTGGGFGGCTVTLVDTDHVHEIADRLCQVYLTRTGRTLTWFVSRPAGGARTLEVT